MINDAMISMSILSRNYSSYSAAFMLSSYKNHRISVEH